MLRRLIWSGLVLASFSAATWRGVNLLPTTERAVAPASVRNAPGGWRSYAMGSRGFLGGK